MAPLPSKKVLGALGGVLLLAAALSADRSPAYRPTEKAFYASESMMNFVRPGLVMKISKAEIATDGTVKAWVKFTDPKGLALEREGTQTPGPITASLGIAYIPADQTQYVSYITRQRTGGGRTVTQATGESNGVWTKIADGEYTYSFATKAPVTINRELTHMVAIYGSRDLRDYDLGRNYADAFFNFVPSGAAVTKVRDVVRVSSCNKCHDQLGMHGGSRRSIEVCNLCHTPQTPEPASNNTTDMKVMIHKIHMGASLPSVVAKTPYVVAGHDYSEVVNPSPTMACTVCHEPKEVSGATQADNWMTNPSREACGSCHDNVNFATGANHANLPQVSDRLCSNCHQPKGSDFDTSITGAHVVAAQSSLLPGVFFEITAVDNAAPGKNPTVTFTLKDKTGKAIPMSQMNSLRLYMAGPTTDFPNYIREDALKASGPGDGRYFWTFLTKIPDTAKGSFQFGIEGYRNVNVLAGTTKARTIRNVGANKVFAVSVDGSKMEPRRAVVDSKKCNNCHFSLSFHGGNRNTAEMCTFCHNSTLVADGLSWNYANMIHRYHSEAHYPGTLNNCTQCHVAGTQLLPLKQGLSSVANPAAPVSPTPVTQNACLACHNSQATWSHVTTHTTQLGESCEVCHGAGREYDVAKVHAQ